MSKQFRQLLILLCCAISASPSFAQNCTYEIERSSPHERFRLLSADTVEDKVTGLQWQRCPLGFQLDEGLPESILDDRCMLDAEHIFDWASAYTATNAFNPDGNPWRIPNVKELASIVEQQCTAPAMNTAIFPDIRLPSNYWTSSNNGISAFLFDFSDGSTTKADAGDSAQQHMVRPVR